MDPIIPVLETERTVMRGWQPGDLDPYLSWASDPEVMQFLGGPADRNQAWRTLALYLGHWQLRGYGQWAVQRAADGELVGRVGLWNPEGWPGIEVGWTFARHAWGQGYATECGAAAIAWAWANLPGLEQILSVIAPENWGSRRVAERLGMSVVGSYVIQGDPRVGEIETVLYGLPRPAA